MEKNNLLPIFIPDNVKHWFEREIVRFIKQPELWNDELVCFKRLFLLMGQSGTQMDAVLAMLYGNYLQDFLEKGVRVQFLRIKDESSYTAFFDEHYVTTEIENPNKSILIIDRVELLLQYHQDALKFKINHLKRLNFLFIICITNEFPNDQYKFWDQFKDRIPMRLPGLDFYKRLLQYRFNQWSTHWKYSKVQLSDKDYDQLSMYCAYCTPKDVIQFTETIFRKIIVSYPEDNLDITLNTIENKDLGFLFTPFFNDDTTYCIINKDKSREQHRFDPALAGDSEINNNSRKRLRSAVTNTTSSSSSVQIGSDISSGSIMN